MQKYLLGEPEELEKNLCLYKEDTMDEAKQTLHQYMRYRIERHNGFITIDALLMWMYSAFILFWGFCVLMSILPYILY